jgi:hypothetical protein
MAVDGFAALPERARSTHAFDQEITMNARISSLHARMAPAALAAAVALAFGLSAPAQAYTYPGSASSSRHAVKSGPVRAEPRERPAYGAAPAHYGYGNPSMQKGEACLPGSNCALHGPNQQSNTGGAGPSGAYGAHESYGYTTSTSAAHKAATPASRNAVTGPVRASAAHGAMNYGPSAASNASFRNSMTGKTSGPNMNPTGQPTSFTGPTGKQVNLNGMGNPTIAGPNGKVNMDGPDLNHPGAGYGHQKGSGINSGISYTSSDGSMSGTRTGGAPGVASADGMNMGNGGVTGMESGSHIPSSGTQSGGHSDADSHTARDWFYDHGVADHPTNGTDDKGNVWQHDVVWTGTDSNGARFRDGKQVGGNVLTADQQKDRNDTINKHPGKEMPADMGPDAGPGELVSGTGQVATPGKKKGQDDGGGQTGDAGTTNSGGRNAQGAYIAPSGQDAPVKPKEVGALKMNYNGKNGAIDPKVNGANGGGG